MILRVFRGMVPPEGADELVAFVRDRAIADGLRTPGLRSFQAALRSTAVGTELVIVSTWTDFDAVLAPGRLLDSPLAVRGAGAFLSGGHADHYELLATEARGIPVSNTTVRVTRALLRPNVEGDYFGRVRTLADGLLDRPGLIAFLVGRRAIQTTIEATTISLWEDEAALRELAGPDLSSPPYLDEFGPYHIAPPVSEEYEGLALTRPREDAPAILLADDERRYVYATPSAARLTGHSVARLLTMRIDDLTAPELRGGVPAVWARFVAEGRMEAAYTLCRADGSAVPVRFSARARSPWPGCHASMLIPQDDPATPDIDGALLSAGLLSRMVLSA